MSSAPEIQNPFSPRSSPHGFHCQQPCWSLSPSLSCAHQSPKQPDFQLYSNSPGSDHIDPVVRYAMVSFKVRQVRYESRLRHFTVGSTTRLSTSRHLCPSPHHTRRGTEVEKPVVPEDVIGFARLFSATPSVGDKLHPVIEVHSGLAAQQFRAKEGQDRRFVFADGPWS